MNTLMEYIRRLRFTDRAKHEGANEFLGTPSENARIQRIMRGATNYETVNGAGEIGWGTAILCFALSSYSYVVLPNSTGGSAIAWLLFLCACVAMPVCRWAIKRFLTWPRTGYVVYRLGAAFWVGMTVAAVVAGGVSIALTLLMAPEVTKYAHSQVNQSDTTNTALSLKAGFFLAAMGPLNAVLYLMMNTVSIKEHRWKWLLLVLLAFGPFAIVLSVPGNYIEVSRPVMLFLGVVCLSSGAVTLINFLCRTPLPQPDAE